MSSKEKNYNVFFIVAIIVSVIVILGTVTYAFYQSSINGTVSGTIAKWSFTANNQTDSFDLNLEKLYPGKSGTYNITLSATNSDLDVYYELIFTYPSGNPINGFLYWDSSYTKPLVDDGSGAYVGKYGVITKGSSVTIPIYFNWSYGTEGEAYINNWTMPEIKIIAKQYTGYSGTIPMNLLGFTNLVSYNNSKNNVVIPTSNQQGPELDQYGYPDDLNYKYKFVAINSTTGFILFSNNFYNY